MFCYGPTPSHASLISRFTFTLSELGCAWLCALDLRQRFRRPTGPKLERIGPLAFAPPTLTHTQSLTASITCIATTREACMQPNSDGNCQLLELIGNENAPSHLSFLQFPPSCFIRMWIPRSATSNTATLPTRLWVTDASGLCAVGSPALHGAP